MKRIVVLLLIILVSVICSVNSYAQLSYRADLTSRFIWRGFDLLPSNHPAFQPSVTYDFGKSGFSVDAWFSFALDERGYYKHNDEVDLTLSYVFKKDKDIELSAGLINYVYFQAHHFKFKENTSQEVFLTAKLVSNPYSPCFSVYYDLNLGTGLYARLEGERPIKITDKISPILSGKIGFNSKQFIDKTGFSDLSFVLTLPLTVGKTTLSPYFGVMFPLMNVVNTSNEWYCGIVIEPPALFNK